MTNTPGKDQKNAFVRGAEITGDILETGLEMGGMVVGGIVGGIRNGVFHIVKDSKTKASHE